MLLKWQQPAKKKYMAEFHVLDLKVKGQKIV